MTEPDLSRVPRFIEHLAARVPEDAEFVAALLEAGWAVKVVWGPQQMDVWELDLVREGWIIQFRIERGIAEGARVVRDADPMPRLDDYCPLNLAVFAWARMQGKAPELTDPEGWGRQPREHRLDALEWLARGDNGLVVERLHAAWAAYRNAKYQWPRKDPAVVKTEGLAAMEAALRLS